MVDLEKVGAHYAVSSLFEEYGEKHLHHVHDVEKMGLPGLAAGKTAGGAGTGQYHFGNHLGVVDDNNFGRAHSRTIV